MIAERMDRIHASPNGAPDLGAGNRFQPAGSLVGVHTRPSSNSISMTESGGGGHCARWTRHSKTASDNELAGYTIEVPTEFQRPPERRAPAPENAELTRLLFTIRNAT